MKKNIFISVRALFVLTIITGVLYPLLITGIAQWAFPFQSNGSLMQRNSRTIGSALIGQKFGNDKYFSPRPSASNYDAMQSGGSNLGPTSKALADSAVMRKALFMQKYRTIVVPPDMLYASASGLDPHVSPASAYAQAARIAAARGLDSLQSVKLAKLIDRLVEAPEFRIFGEPRVNVLLLNLALDTEFQ